MDLFEKMTMRLKQQLGIKADKEVAGLLGISPTAWIGRKKRGSFPDTELLALMTKRPDLNIDFDYVTTGIASSVFGVLAEEAKPEHFRNPAKAGALTGLISVEEQNILRAYRTANDNGKRALIAVAALINEKGNT